MDKRFLCLGEENFRPRKGHTHTHATQTFLAAAAKANRPSSNTVNFTLGLDAISPTMFPREMRIKSPKIRPVTNEEDKEKDVRLKKDSFERVEPTDFFLSRSTQ